MARQPLCDVSRSLHPGRPGALCTTGGSARRRSRPLIIRLFAVLLTSVIATVALAAPGLTAGALNEFKVELPTDLRKVAGRGKLSPVTHALVTIAVPANFDPSRDWPVLVVSATTDFGYNSSRQLLRDYAETALKAGWIAMAADPADRADFRQDTVPLRLALNLAALSVLDQQWPRTGRAPIAVGGFSGGSKVSGWVAAAFVSEGRTVIGAYLAGINQESLVSAGKLFDVLNPGFKRIPVFLQSGLKDNISTPAEHRDVAAELKRAGFKNVRVEYFPGEHDVYPGPLRAALDWFRELAALPLTAK